jgi:hypothetical protein
MPYSPAGVLSGPNPRLGIILFDVSFEHWYFFCRDCARSFDRDTYAQERWEIYDVLPGDIPDPFGQVCQGTGCGTMLKEGANLYDATVEGISELSAMSNMLRG